MKIKRTCGTPSNSFTRSMPQVIDKDKSLYGPCTLSGDKLYVMKEDDIVSVYQLDLETMHLTSVL